MKSSFSPQLFAFGNPDISALSHLLENIPDQEVHYFFGLIVKITRGSVHYITDPEDIPNAIRIDPTLFHGNATAVERRIGKLSDQNRIPNSFDPTNLKYTKNKFSEEFYTELAFAESPLERQDIIKEYYSYNNSKIKSLLLKTFEPFQYFRR